MNIIIYALGVITGLLVTFIIEMLVRKPSERNQPFSKLIPKEKGVILEQNPIYDSFINYDPSRDTEDTLV